MGVENARRQQPHDQREAERQEDEDVEESEDRNKIGNEIDRVRRIGQQDDDQRAHVQWRARVECCPRRGAQIFLGL